VDTDGFVAPDGGPSAYTHTAGSAATPAGPRDIPGSGTCRTDPVHTDGFEDGDGCPDPDNAGPGSADVADGEVGADGFGSCRNLPEDKDGFEDTDGCPDPDNDKDGIPDIRDGDKDASGYGSCRDLPETVNDYADEDGCPDTAPKRVRVTQFQIEILEKVFFEYNKATIQPVSFTLLDEVASVLFAHPALTKIRVEGHTDYHGDDAYNLELSQQRADAVLSYLATHGVAPSRLESKGWGEERPLIPGRAGRTNAGRAKNRRVEFHIIEVNGQPHSPEKPVILEKHEEVP
jgi:outer membrane protein OmpA-like peptidoglycan-associated protein